MLNAEQNLTFLVIVSGRCILHDFAYFYSSDWCSIDGGQLDFQRPAKKLFQINRMVNFNYSVGNVTFNSLQ